MAKFKSWITELRAPFLTGTLVSILLGTAIAWARQNTFHLGYFALALVGGTLLHLGGNVANDYFDHKSGNDEINKEFIQPFSGGSRMIQLGLLTSKEVLSGAVALYSAAAFVGVYLAWTRGLFILLLAILGTVSGIFYTFPPFNWVRMGLGEAIVGMNFGALMTLGSYYVQTRILSLEPLVASIPISLLIIAILYINEFPDYNADRNTRKKTAVVRLGRAKAARGFRYIVVLAYVFILLNVFAGTTPLYTLLALIPFPLALESIRKVLRFHSDYPKLAPAMALTIVFHFLTSFLVSCGYLIHGLLAESIALGFAILMISIMLGILPTLYFYLRIRSPLIGPPSITLSKT